MIRVTKKTTCKDYSKYHQDIYKLPDHLLPKVNIIINQPIKRLKRTRPEHFLFRFDVRTKNQERYNMYKENIKKRKALKNFIMSITPPKRFLAKTQAIYFVQKKPNNLEFNGNISVTVSNFHFFESIIFDAINNLTI